MYGTQTLLFVEPDTKAFENDVKMYGTQTANGQGFLFTIV